MYHQQKEKKIPRYLEHLGISFCFNKRKRSGPSTDICGIPHATVWWSQFLWNKETNSKTVFCYLNEMQTSHLRHLACHNTPSWLIKFYGQLYQILNINPRRCYKSSVSAILLLIFVPYRSRGEEHGWLNTLIESQISYCVR